MTYLYLLEDWDPTSHHRPSRVGVNVDGLACPLHQPIAYGHQIRGWDFMLGVALSCRDATGGGTFLGDAKPPGLDIW
jgi:hypothetical protein